MVSVRGHTRTLCIAFLAIAGGLSAPDAASADMLGGAAKGRRDCCATRPMAGCGCCVAPAPASRPAGPILPVPPHATSPDGTGRPCECRVDTPNAPASKSERPSSEQRRDLIEQAGPVRHLVIHDRPTSPWRPRVLPGDSSAEAPIYLLTSHFLC